MKGLDYLFHPRSIAIVGASADPAKRGHTYLAQLQGFGYPGGLYPVNPKGGTIMGMPVYPTLSDIPGDVDYVISVVPAEKLQCLAELAVDHLDGPLVFPVTLVTRCVHRFSARLLVKEPHSENPIEVHPRKARQRKYRAQYDDSDP